MTKGTIQIYCIHLSSSNKEGKFLKKLRCCIQWESIAGNLVLTTELKM